MSAPGDRGLRPAVPADCRRALRAAQSPTGPSAACRRHLAACSFCAARQHAGAHLGSWLKARPEVPAALRRPEMLDCIRERLIEHVEAGPVGTWLEEAHVAMPSGAEQVNWQDAVSENDAHEIPAHRGMAGGLVQAPRQPDTRVWSRVRRSILADIAAAARSNVRRNPLRWRILLAGAAASVVLGLFVVSEGTPSTPTIVFTELQRAPDMDFAVVRYGSRR